MIISLSQEVKQIEIPELENIDVICFFHREKAIHADQSLWWEVLTTSLRLKRSVLILESEIDAFPVWDITSRWQTSANWSWLTPRSLRVISEAYPERPSHFKDFKTFLKSSK